MVSDESVEEMDSDEYEYEYEEVVEDLEPLLHDDAPWLFPPLPAGNELALVSKRKNDLVSNSEQDDGLKRQKVKDEING